MLIHCSSFRPNVMPNSATIDPWSDSTPSQAGSDSYISGSAFGSHTPISSASSQQHHGHGKSPTASHGPSATQKQRYWLYIRQQPRAGRACSNGRDRRAIDPPPVVQLQISDFDPNSPDDMEDMQDQSFVVHCFLRTASLPARDVSVIMCQDDNSSGLRAERQINGNLDASPFFCDEDPDPNNAPLHPSSQLYYPLHTPTSKAPRRNLPATFFYFADLSIRRAGVYRLEFQLVRVRMDGRPVPMLHTVLSEPFNVVNAKDFDHVQPSTPLVRGLIASQAGFPLKLKQGSRARRESPEE
jgi:Velvet factor